MAHRFDPSIFVFLRDLKANNKREWFQANKKRYEVECRDQMLDFIQAFSEPLAAISTATSSGRNGRTRPSSWSSSAMTCRSGRRPARRWSRRARRGALGNPGSVCAVWWGCAGDADARQGLSSLCNPHAPA